MLTTDQKNLRIPKCPYFANPAEEKTQERKCGGCSSQHIPYDLQLENKKARLISEINYNNIQIFRDDEWFYRNRMDMVFTPEGLGFREQGKWWRTLPIKQCVISNTKLNGLITEINQFFGPGSDHGEEGFDYFNVKTHEGTFKYAVIRTPQNDSSVSIVLNQESPRFEEAKEKVKAYAQVSTANHVLITLNKAKNSQSAGEVYEVLKGSDMLEETILGKTFHYSVQGFFQNNSIMAEQMHAYVYELLKKYDRKYAHLLDLYGGVGAFGIINAPLFHGMTTIESFEGCTVAAKANIERSQLQKAEAICLDAKRLKQVKFPNSPLFVITDPPRSGMDQETIIQLRKLKPEVIVYISCNVEQLGKDLPKFSEYQIKSAALFDLFPQTNHMESVVELVRQ